MKRLDKMLLINWHYIRRQLLEFKDVNFLTGKNGAGKSTIIDALQLMMLGDTTGHFFNKAASERSTRSLKGYLQGEVAEDAESNTVYLRSGKDFSSYIVLEFFDTVTQKRFCLGIVFDSYKDGDNKHRFFYLKDALPPQHFHFENVPMNIRTLRAFLSNHYDGKLFQLFETNTEYRQVMAGVLGHLNERFFRLFRKAVPFSPIMNIKQFITEFVCDTENQVDISHMQENIRQYKQLEEELAWVEKRLLALEEINKQFAAYREESDRLFIQQYLLDRAAVAKQSDDLTARRQEIAELVTRIQVLTTEITQTEETLAGLTVKRDRLLEERARSDIYQQEQRLKEQKGALEREVAEAKNSVERLNTLLASHFRSWREAISWCAAHISELLPEHKMPDKLALLDDGSRDYNYLRHEDLHDLKSGMDGYLGELQKLHYQLEQEKHQVQAEAGQLQKEITGLKHGIKPYNPILLDLKEAIAAECHTANPQIFAELLEIKDPKWQNAIEGYLHTQKFYLLVEPQTFNDALRIYDHLKFERLFYDLGLVDIEKILAQSPTPLPGSLAEEVETDNPLARAYADYLLGRVMKCDDVTALRNHRTAITPDGMLYHNYVARQLHPKRYEHPYIGQRALARMLLQKQERLNIVNERLLTLTPLVTELSRLRTIPALSQYDIDNILTLKSKAATVSALETQWRTITEQLGQLDLSYLVRLDKSIEACGQEITATRMKLDSKRDSRTEAATLRKNKEESLPFLEKEQERLTHELAMRYETSWCEETGEPRFQAELKSRRTAAAIIAAFTPVVKGTETKKQDKWEAVVDLRTAYNRDFKGSYSPTSATNDAYDNELSRLRDTLLLDYREKIKSAKERAQEQFREDFISKLRANIEKVEEQIKDINRAIKDNFFGRDQYRFTVTPNAGFRRFYDMITDDMLIEGFNLFSGTFLEKHGDTVDELFRQIVDIGEGTLSADQRQRLAENLDRFTDYRTYLDFDMVNIDDEGRESRLSRVLTKKSGGETQTPFYIAVLASFLQLYRVRQGDEDTLRLIVFDEAYSKMDHQRIRESIRLIRDLGLQVILSAPTEKIGDIAPLMDRNLCVIRVKRETMVKAFDPQELLEMGA
jgi:energy-coupling factor transporter ATP-binding protein EcfA2